MVDALVAAGHQVRVVDNFSTGKRENLAQAADRIDLRAISITDREALAEAMQGVDYVFHFAALASVPRSVADPLANNEHNVTGTLNLLLAARDAGVQRWSMPDLLAFARSHRDKSEICGSSLSPNAVAKLAAEHYCSRHQRLVWKRTGVFQRVRPARSLSTRRVIPKFVVAMPTISADVEARLQSRDSTYMTT